MLQAGQPAKHREAIRSPCNGNTGSSNAAALSIRLAEVLERTRRKIVCLLQVHARKTKIPIDAMVSVAGFGDVSMARP